MAKKDMSKKAMKRMRRLHDEGKLPKWARELLAAERARYAKLAGEAGRLREAHVLLNEQEWFSLPGPLPDEGRDTYTLYLFRENQAVAVCSLGRGDRLLVGRKRKVKE